MQGLARLFPIQLEDLKAGAELCHPLPSCLFWQGVRKLWRQKNQELHGTLGKDEKCSGTRELGGGKNGVGGLL